MRGKSSSSKSRTNNVSGGVLETDKLEKLKEPHLSGAYIRSLVKQLTSSRTKDSSSPLEGHGIPSTTNHNLSENDQKQEPKSQSPQPHKKQVRRRLHTSRPYQEKLLNMAEARREIVTALKFHRASMREASEKQQQQQLEVQPLESSSSHQLSLEHEAAKLKSRRNPRIYASNSSAYNSLDDFSYSPGFCSPYTCPVSSICPPPPPPPQSFFQENLSFSLPSQALGLNLNLQDFTNLDTSSLYCGSNPSSTYSSLSPSTTSSSTPSAATEEIVVPAVESGLHQAMDDKEMEEIRSIGEQHEVEWSDRMNLMSSACWFKFLKDMEIDQEAEEFVSSPFDEVLEFPPWLNPNESCLQDVVDDYCFDGYSQDPALPCMDIEEIEGMDGDWLA